jgi:hypothetical protein
VAYARLLLPGRDNPIAEAMPHLSAATTGMYDAVF